MSVELIEFVFSNLSASHCLPGPHHLVVFSGFCQPVGLGVAVTTSYYYWLGLTPAWGNEFVFHGLRHVTIHVRKSNQPQSLCGTCNSGDEDTACYGVWLRKNNAPSISFFFFFAPVALYFNMKACVLGLISDLIFSEAKKGN